MDFYTEIEKEIKSGKIRTKSQLESVKFRIAKDLRMEWIPGGEGKHPHYSEQLP